MYVTVIQILLNNFSASFQTFFPKGKRNIKLVNNNNDARLRNGLLVLSK